MTLPAAAQSGDDDERARVHFQAGSQYYEVGDYELAAREFEQAYELSGRVELLYNLYSAHDRAGSYEPAADALERYLEREAEMEPARRASLTQRLERLRARIDADSDVGPNEPAPTRTDDSEGSAPIAGIVALIGAGALGATFGVFALLSGAEHAELEDSECGRSRTCTESQVSTLDTYNLVADVSLGLAAASAVTGVILVLAHDGGSPPEHARLTPTLGPGIAGLTVEGPL
jgi:tetratricopeptide (TPR) repeat protein